MGIISARSSKGISLGRKVVLNLHAREIKACSMTSPLYLLPRALPRGNPLPLDPRPPPAPLPPLAPTVLLPRPVGRPLPLTVAFVAGVMGGAIIFRRGVAFKLA